MSETFDPDPGFETDEKPAPRRGSVLTLPVLLALAWIVYETTENPAMAAILMCVKFGWDDFLTAFWLLEKDRDRPRAWACCSLYAAAGLWRTAVAGLFMSLMACMLTELLPKQWQQGRGMFVAMAGAALVIFAGFSASIFATTVAIAIARRYHIRFWLSDGTHGSRKRGEWPPCRGNDNHLGRVYWTTFICFILIGVPLVACIVGVCMAELAQNILLTAAAVFVSAGGFLVFLLNLLVVMPPDRFRATHPCECWELEEDDFKPLASPMIRDERSNW